MGFLVPYNCVYNVFIIFMTNLLYPVATERYSITEYHGTHAKVAFVSVCNAYMFVGKKNGIGSSTV